MRKTDTARLDPHALVRQLEATGLKQGWIAARIGVTAKTVGRWVGGKVERIALDNLAALADVLGCAPDALTVPDEADVHATRHEQRTAARLIRERDLLRTLSPTDDWALAESLVKATMEPNLPLVDLGHLYNLLSIAAWRQGRYDEGRAHALRARGIGERIGDRALAHKGTFNLATIASLCGDEDEARVQLEACLAEPEHLGSDAGIAATWSNLGGVYRSLLRFADAEQAQRRSIALFAAHGLRYNLAISELSLSQVLAEWGRFDEAEQAALRSREHAEASGYARGAVQAWFYVADARSLAGDLDVAGIVREHLPRLRAHAVFDLGCLERAARVLRRAGATDEARAVLDDALARSARFPTVHGLMSQERARLARATGDVAAEASALQAADEAFAKAGAPQRRIAAPIGEYGSGGVLDAAARSGAPAVADGATIG